MSTPADSFILDLEARQEAALRQLIELEQRLEAVLREAQPAIARPLAQAQFEPPQAAAASLPFAA
jgi:hypothetical protein